MTCQDKARAGKDDRPGILCIAGFGDNATMYDALASGSLASHFRITPLDLPGFGAPALPGTTSLAALAAFVADRAKRDAASIIVAHSVASIVASLAAQQPGCPLTNILSLEGNLTADDAYFSGMAADFEDPETFRAAFLGRLDSMAGGSPILTRYRDAVASADSLALWQLGKDAKRFSEAHVPGQVLQAAAADVTYFYNPENCPTTSVAWLEISQMRSVILPGASHWPSVDKPGLLAQKMAQALTPDSVEPTG